MATNFVASASTTVVESGNSFRFKGNTSVSLLNIILSQEFLNDASPYTLIFRYNT